MTPQAIGYISIGALFFLLALRVPIAFVMLTVGFFGYMAIAGLDSALFILGSIPYARIASYTFTVIPLFILMGYFADQAGFVTDIFETLRKFIGHLPGGVVHATIFGGAAFGACCGSGTASCAVMAKVTIPPMLQQGVQRKLAFGTVAAAGTLAAMIPPSNVMVIYGIITEQSIGKLLIGGIIPGIVEALVFVTLVFIMVKIKPDLAPPVHDVVTWKERLVSLKGVWGIGVLAIIISGGIYSGIFTPTEAGAVGAFGTFMLALALRKLKWSDLGKILLETTRTTGMLFLLIACASVFGYLMGITRIPTQVSQFITGLTVDRYVILVGIMLLYLVLGCVMDSISFMILTMPIIFPGVVALGFNPIWFGILMVAQAELALLTPPFALNVFVLKGVVGECTTEEVVAGVGPFIIAGMVALILFIIFPQMVLWLPSMMR